MAATQSVPRFLLPRLSWAPASASAFSTPGTVSALLFSRGSRANDHTYAPSQWQTRVPSPVSRRETRSSHTTRQYKPSIPTQTLRRSFHATAPQRRDHHFDTLRFVQRLQEEGFTEEQAVAMMKVLNDVIEESIQNLTRTMVLREDAAKATYTQKVDFAKLRSELLSADSTESNTTRAAHERLTNDIAKFSSRLRDEIGRTTAGVRLDLNLEKGRIREEAVSQELKIKETETKIEQEVAALRQQLEQVKFQSLQWLIGVCSGFAALMLGAWRLLM
ncbi:DUF1640 domain-protein [Podospora australis]|uniref:DUF1640 domain-protein n=1 Tax=Podospora australis TaxID=1536484 RepID=A0AAN6WY72_9PEZI|nr:DUF1640 domain-protein [Podospora australis]